MSEQTHRDDYSRALAKQIDAEREVRGWTARYTYERAGMSRSTWERIQAGAISPKVGQITALAGAYGISGSELLRRAEARLSEGE